mmetsp:Transcript_25819/g.50571  ORF Transcript_25819/g.50571 Transcript_25819/m.50571 type:complete len:81 (+) Transcript_25819:864-1106(+)
MEGGNGLWGIHRENTGSVLLAAQTICDGKLSSSSCAVDSITSSAAQVKRQRERKGERERERESEKKEKILHRNEVNEVRS